MNILKRTRLLTLSVLLVAVAGCDLDVTNENAPDQRRALATPGDVESLIAGSFHRWWNINTVNGAWFGLNSASFQTAGNPANFANLEFSSFPRAPIRNSQSAPEFGHFAFAWNASYGALAAVGDGLKALNNDPSLGEALDAATPNAETRARAFAKFMQGLGHATLALQYDQGFVVDETFDAEVTPEAVPYADVLDAALGYFDEAIAIASGASFTIPQQWIGVNGGLSSERLARLAHSMKARHMAAVARSPAERENAMGYGWQSVLNEIDAGIQNDFALWVADGHYCYSTCFTTDAVGYLTFSGWQQQNYFILGMADQSGNYQRWLAQPLGSRLPYFGSQLSEDPFLIQTPDTRFPTGATQQEQVVNPGDYYVVPGPESPIAWEAFPVEGRQFTREARGIWRWSYYRDRRPGALFFSQPYAWPEMPLREMRLLAAEAYIHLGQPGSAAPIINETRTAHGLSATDAAGTNTSCVPRLPNGTCGDLMEMMKWEKRLENQYQGLLGVPWYFDGRGWGDLYAGTTLHFPIPADDLLVLSLTPYDVGGCGQEGGAPRSVYDWPDQC